VGVAADSSHCTNSLLVALCDAVAGPLTFLITIVDDRLVLLSGFVQGLAWPGELESAMFCVLSRTVMLEDTLQGSGARIEKPQSKIGNTRVLLEYFPICASYLRQHLNSMPNLSSCCIRVHDTLLVLSNLPGQTPRIGSMPLL
jgi:hypothetical protein